MVKLNTILSYMICLSFLSSCTEDDNPGKDQGTVSFFDAGYTSRSSQENNKFDKGDAIGVFAIDPLTGKYWSSNSRYVYDGTRFNPSSDADKILITKGYNLDYHVYYPYSSSNTNISEIHHVISDQSSRDSWLSADLLSARHSGPIVDYTVPLHFTRKNTTVEVTVNRNEGANSATLQNVCYNATYNLLTGSSTVSESRKDIKMFKYSDKGNTTVFRTTIPVQQLTRSNYISLSGSGSNEIKLQSSTDLVLKAGNIHPYTIEYKKDITINDYIPGGTTTGAGLYKIGTSCTVSSTPKSGYEFAGWYEKGAIVWNDKNYTFDVMSDRVLEPHYRSYAPWSLVLNVSPTTISTSGGTANLSSSATRKIMINDKETSETERIEYPHPSLSVTSSDPDNFRIEGKIIRVQENTTTTPRTATITASCGGVSKSVTLTQAGRTEEYTFTIDGATSVVHRANSTEGYKDFNIVSKKRTVVDGTSRTDVIGWKATSFPFGNISNTGRLFVTENPEKTVRKAEITLTQNGSGKTVTITIVQKGKNEIIIDPTK